MGYWVVVPFAYLLAGTTKFAVNCVRHRQLAFDQIGLGGLPSTHTAIVSAPAWLLVMDGMVHSEVFAVALSLVAIVVIDAMDLRRKLERVHDVLKQELPDSVAVQGLRRRVGHNPLEVAAGLAVGAVAAGLIHWLDLRAG
ncbi:MAG TPA: divergent PAP2 family protein [Rhizomicrobium sp.]|nr:divergent PAP2 family protein [Rhizomicrobium sp.]